MADEGDSVDTSQLKALVLGLEPKFPEAAVASTSANAESKRRKRENAPAEETASKRTKTTSDGDSTLYKPAVHGRKIPRFSASQPELPSTIPDSVKPAKMSHGSQRSGDTQPLSQWVYDAYQEDGKSLISHKPAPESNVNTQGKDLPFTNSETQTGHLDLVGIFDQASTRRDMELEDQNVDDLGELSQLDVHAELYPEDSRFKQPKTPATTGKNKNSNGTLVPQEPVTPSLPINPFANNTEADVGVMGLSQVFRTTQAPSSPFTTLLLSDGTSDRPSPAMYGAHRQSTDRPNSSPAKLPRQGPRSGNEPQEKYISLQESQAEREERLRVQSTSSPLRNKRRVQEESDDEFDQVETRIRRQRRQKEIEREAQQQFERVTAKSRPGTSNRNRAGGTRRNDQLHARSFAVTPQAPKGTVIISDDLQLDELEGNASEDETEREEEINTPETELPDELAEDNKENMDTRRVQVPMTSSRTPRKSYDIPSPRSSPIRQKLKSLPLSDDVDELAADGDDNQGHPPPMDVPLVEVAQTVAIADSQPSQAMSKQRKTTTTKKGHVSEPKSSLDSRLVVPQSQLQPLPNTSQIDSQMARRILNGSSQLLSIANTSSQTPRSPILPQDSSPPQRASLSKSRLDSGNSPSEDRRLPTQLGSSPPRVPSRRQISDVQGYLSSSPSTVLSPVPRQTTLIRHENNGSSNLPIPAKPGSSSERRPKNHASIDLAQTPLSGMDTLRSTIPETCSALRLKAAVNGSPQTHDMSHLGSLATTGKSNSPSKTSHIHRPSTSSTLFETARTHSSPTKSRPQLLRQSSEPHKSPKKPNTRLTRTFGDIAADPSPPDELGMEDVDIGLLTSEDVEFQALMEGSSPINPTRKRRRIYDGRAIHVVEPRSSSTPVAPTNLPVVTEDANEQAPPDITEKAVVPPDNEKPAPAKEARERRGVAARLVDTADFNGTSQSSRPSRKTQLRNQNGKDGGANYSENEISSAKQTASEADRTGVSNEATTTTPAPAVQESVIAPNRVFAHFNGSYAGYYPATCVMVVGGDEPKYRVRFDDGTVDVVNAVSVKKLELRPGDPVKIDKPGARSHNYAVVSLRDKQPSLIEAISGTPGRRGRPSNAVKFPVTDIFGYTNVVVRLKQLQSGAFDASDQSEEVVPLTSVYLTTTLWKSIRDRPYSFHSTLPPPISGLRTPSDRPSTPSTPSSRSRRVKTGTKSASSAFSFSAIPRNTSNLFDNVVFCITNIENSDIRKETEHNIRSNGGQLLENGFEELFHVPDITSSSPSHVPDPDPELEPCFQVKPSFATRGFTCLIADKHCRKQNFLQALALGIPCLATRWVRDCIAAKALLPWEPYLLPSGESTFLNAIRSRHLPSYAPDAVTLPAIIGGRLDFLAGANVLLIMGKGKEEAMMKAYPFIAYALGASRVSRATTLEAARRALEEGDAKGERWDWVCYHEGEKAVGRLGKGKVEGALLGGGGGGRSGGKGTKRKSRGGGGGEEPRKPRVVVTEFVVQSLILGRLVEGA